MKKVIADHEVTSVDFIGRDQFIIRLQAPGGIPEILPGNFAEIRIYGSPDVFLRRPFSILDVDHETNTLSFYVKIIGKGTRSMGMLRKGNVMNLIYPLGNSFSLPVEGKEALIVAGGTGIAPFILLGRLLKKQHIATTFLIGGRSAEDIALTNEFSKYGEVLVTTEDGSLGERGMVTGHSVFRQSRLPFGKIYTCGPDLMMKAVAKIAHTHSIPCEASLENTMACGFGACLSCVTETVEGNKCVCTAGPVFNTNYLTWLT